MGFLGLLRKVYWLRALPTLSRGPEFGSQHWHDGSQPFISRDSGVVPLKELCQCGAQACVCIKTHIHKIN